ncbi:hypothetical protein EGR_06592 [Echinococcus granulosus]|uniref:Uncharacterized protein n=1 Tax=Echinococcus granulosus TaxID=6210 RepID=W6UBV6_ECHGR|nr:hypothetical protein EGR_06592 [Echinococcus granulosus]EUB58605.1 hypothetical protein EGR_06592 [Echinococcus granulosus]
MHILYKIMSSTRNAHTHSNACHIAKHFLLSKYKASIILCIVNFVLSEKNKTLIVSFTQLQEGNKSSKSFDAWA